MYICIYAYMHICIYVYMYICIYVYMYIHVMPVYICRHKYSFVYLGLGMPVEGFGLKMQRIYDAFRGSEEPTCTVLL